MAVDVDHAIDLGSLFVIGNAQSGTTEARLIADDDAMLANGLSLFQPAANHQISDKDGIVIDRGDHHFADFDDALVLLAANDLDGQLGQTPSLLFAKFRGFFGRADALGLFQRRGGLLVGVFYLSDFLDSLLDGVLPAAEKTDAANVHGHLAGDDEIGAHIHVGVGKRILDLRQGDAPAFHRVGVQVNFVAFDRAAAAGDVDNARHAPELAFEHPILECFEIVLGIDVLVFFVLGALERIAIDFAGGALGRQLRIDSRRKLLRKLEPVDDFLLRHAVIVAVLELQTDVR